jgi:uncharacterized delta-60 repeat protein
LIGQFALPSANASLSADPAFRAPLFAEASTAGRNLLLPDGKVLLFSKPNTLTDQRTGAITRYLPDGTLDTAFNFTRIYKSVSTVALAPDGKLYVAATKYIYGKKEAEEILRLNNDGSIEASFNKTAFQSDIGATVQQIRVQPDGILVAGFLATSFGAGDSIIRLMPDGTVDSSFAVPQIDGFVMASAVQSDGRILVAGNFSNVNGVTHRGIVRLNSNGSLDPSFQGSGFTLGNTTRALVVQNDGKIMMAGHFRIGTGSFAPRAPLLRLNTDGSIDTSFSSANTIPSLVGARDLVLQPDGKFVATVNNSVYRFDTNGSKDTTFRQPVMVSTQFNPAGDPGSPSSLHLLSDGRLLVGGSFTDVDPIGSARPSAHFGMARLNADGTLDSSLTSSHKTGIETAPSSFARLDDGSTLAAFGVKIDPAIPFNLGRLFPDGSLDPNFTLSSSNPDSFLLGGFVARGLEPLPDGKFFIFGSKANFSSTYGRVLSSGVEDNGYAPNPTVPPVQDAITLPDGKVLLSGGTDPQAALYVTLSRLKADGQMDDTFQVPDIQSSQVERLDSGMLWQMYVGTRVLAVLNDGRTLFEYLSLDGFFHLLLLDTDGSIESGFAPTSFGPFDLTENFPAVFDPVMGQVVQPPEGVWTASLPLLDAHVQSDGRIVVAGQFKSYNGTPARGLVRIETNGAIESTFNVGGGAQWIETTETATLFPKVENIEPQADGKLIITGTFEAFNGVTAPGIARLNSDGSVDTSFVAPARRDKRSRAENAFEQQPDGSFLLSGPYTFPNETLSPSFLRLIDLPPMAVNVSTRLAVGTGDDALIEGFIVQGPAGSSKKIMVRALGPSLAQFGVGDALANPTLEIRNSNNAIVATNNDWKTTQVGGLITGDQFAELTASQLAPSHDLESAMIANLAPGSYTAVVRGAGNTAGTGLVDAFDLSPSSSARLANVATRGLIQPGDKLMIAGFIVQNGPMNVVLRAIGPSLSIFGISNALPDTTLQLRDQNGGIVLENDDWKSHQREELEAAHLQPSHDLEAAVITTIQPGQYTAQVRGKGQDSGIGVVEVYFPQ